MNAGESIGFAVWVILSVIWLVVLNYRQERFEERCQHAKEMQDRINEKFQGYAEQVEKDLEKIEDRVSKSERKKG